MKIIALIGQKGGTGKTTTATALAVAAVEAGQGVALIDLDPQCNAANWKDRRPGESPAVVSAQPSRLQHVLEAARAGGADLAIIDTPGKLDAASIAASKAADLVLIPMRSGVFDVETLKETRNLLHAAQDPACLVLLNGVHPTGRAYLDAEAVIQAMGYAVAPVRFANRAAFKDAPNSGQGPTDYEPDGKAAEEVRALYSLIVETLRNQEITISRNQEKEAANG